MIPTTAKLPEFLGLLESDPPKAAEMFYTYAFQLLSVCPPRIMRMIEPSEKDDLIQEIAIHCIANDLRVLKTYRRQSVPFEAWFYMVARNKILDHLKMKGRRVQFADPPIDDRDDSGQPGKQQKQEPEMKDMLNSVETALEDMDRKCRLLLKLAAREFKPSEMARILRLPAEEAKKLSNDLGYCRRKLRDLLASGGMNMDGILG